MAVAFNIGDFLITCQKYQHLLSYQPDEKIRKSEYRRISPAINRINTALSNPQIISEAELARVCEMSVSNFRRVFKLETGLSPKAYITKARMDYAEYLLKNTNMTITEIAEKLGYNAVCGFNKIFSSFFGMSPSNYRKKYKWLNYNNIIAIL
jgi:AraC-like DNA-binding protein